MPPVMPAADPSPKDDALDAQVGAFLSARPLIQAHIRSLGRDAALAEGIFQEIRIQFERTTRQGDVITHVPACCRANAPIIALESRCKKNRPRRWPHRPLHRRRTRILGHQRQNPRPLSVLLSLPPS